MLINNGIQIKYLQIGVKGEDPSEVLIMPKPRLPCINLVPQDQKESRVTIHNMARYGPLVHTSLNYSIRFSLTWG